MAKTSRPERRRHDRARQPSEYEEHVIEIARVTRVVKGGRRLRFRATVVTGNRQGKVGLGIGKARDVQSAIQKAVAQAHRRMIKIPLVNGTIPHEVNCKLKAAKIRLLPATPGTGIIAGGSLRPVLDLAGVKNVLSKRFGTRNALVNAQAAMLALGLLRFTAPPYASLRKTKEEKMVSGGVEGEGESSANKLSSTVREVSSEEVSAEGTLKG